MAALLAGEPTRSKSALCAFADEGRGVSALMDFTIPSTASKWSAVDDRIMGGSSTSMLAFRDGYCSFEGDLIIEGGGFASAKCIEPFTLPSDLDAVNMEVRSDGRMGYKLTLSSAAAPDGVSYQYMLPQLEASMEFTTLRAPLAAFRPTYRGRPALDMPALRAEDVRGVGLMLSRYEVDGGVKAAIAPGAFRLDIKRLTPGKSELAMNAQRWVQPRN